MGTLNAAVVGAGIGGLTTAIALQQRGMSVTVYERAPLIQELGAGVVIGPNAAKVYRELDLLDSIAAIAGKCSGWLVKTWQGETIPAWVTPYPTDQQFPLHRAEFQKLLFNALPPGTVRLGCGVSGATEDGDEVRVALADGTAARADVLVGADGIHSVVQSLVATKSEPVSEGTMAYRALIPAERLEGIHDLRAMLMWVGPGQSFLTYPVSANRLLNLVAFVPTDLDVEESWSAPGRVSALAAAFAGWDPQLQQIIGAIEHTFRWGIYDRPPLASWSTERITLLGDAAHAIVPHIGQGANQAVEDAITLATLLEDAGPLDVAARLRLYDELRIDRNRQVRDGARAAGEMYRSTDLAPEQRRSRSMGIFDSLNIAEYDAQRVARDALAAPGGVAPQLLKDGRVARFG